MKGKFIIFSYLEMIKGFFSRNSYFFFCSEEEGMAALGSESECEDEIMMEMAKEFNERKHNKKSKCAFFLP